MEDLKKWLYELAEKYNMDASESESLSSLIKEDVNADNEIIRQNETLTAQNSELLESNLSLTDEIDKLNKLIREKFFDVAKENDKEPEEKKKETIEELLVEKEED